jgi:hypothetical protein
VDTSSTSIWWQDPKCAATALFCGGDDAILLRSFVLLLFASFARPHTRSDKLGDVVIQTEMDL